VLEAVDVDVGDGDEALVGVHEHKRRAGDRLLHAEGAPEALHEGGLPRAQIAGEQDEVAGAGQGGHLPGQSAGVVDRLGAGRQHDAPAPASTFLARIRSARILATTSPPPPWTAAEGWNV